MLDPGARRCLLQTARKSLEACVASGQCAPFPTEVYPDTVQVWRSCFVTLEHEGKLRGCCGRIEPERPLIEDAWYNAHAAARQDPRFPPVRPDELVAIALEVSVLTPLETLDVRNMRELLEALVPHRDGLVLEHADERTTFLPRVWETLPDAWHFVRQLRRKAGWPEDGWETDLKAWRFQAESFSAATPTALPREH